MAVITSTTCHNAGGYITASDKGLQSLQTQQSGGGGHSIFTWRTRIIPLKCFSNGVAHGMDIL